MANDTKAVFCGTPCGFSLPAQCKGFRQTAEEKGFLVNAALVVFSKTGSEKGFLAKARVD